MRVQNDADQARLKVQQFGPIRDADITFGDLTVFVGPQATGKSIFLQLYKLLLDKAYIHQRLLQSNLGWQNRLDNFFILYFGDGMEKLYREGETRIVFNGKPINLKSYAETRGGKKSQADERLFYIPAQRVLVLQGGRTRPFTDYNTGDPFVLREFSDRVHQLVQSELAHTKQLFPQPKRLREEFRKQLDQSIFAGYALRMEEHRLQRSIVLTAIENGQVLPYLVWSAGQREFIPLLLGLYWLIPAGRITRRESVPWVVIEEPEMGLHPKAILTVMALILELVSRGYRVCLTTHSAQVLDLVWALQIFQRYAGEPKDVLRLLELRGSGNQQLASKALQIDINVYYFKRDGKVKDISGLDPASLSEEEGTWGGLLEFASRANDVVAAVVNRFERHHASLKQ